MALPRIPYGTLSNLAGGMAGRAAAALGGLALSVAVARLAGPEGLGRFSVALVAMAVMVVLARLGLDTCLLRTAARRIAEDRPEQAPGLLRYVLVRTGLQATGLAGAVWLAALVWQGWTGGDALVLMILVWAVPPVTLATVAAAYLRAHRRQGVASLLEIGGLSAPVAAVLGIMLAAGTAPGLGMISALFVGLVWLVSTVAVAWTLMAAHRIGGGNGNGNEILWPDPAARAELRAGHIRLVIIAIAGFLTHAGSFLIVGPLLDEEALGLARAAERLALLIVFTSVVINIFAAPRIVGHVTHARWPALRQLVVKSCLLSTGLALPIALALLIFPRTILELFGTGFAGAAPLLVILSLGQLAIAATEPLSALLSMSRREALLMRITLALFAASLLALPLGALLFEATGFVVVYALLLGARSGLIFLAARKTLRDLERDLDPERGETGHGHT